MLVHFSGRIPVFFKFKRPAVAKLDFIIAGAQKAGTTALSGFLENHPKIKMPHKDELHRTIQPARHFFDDEDRFAEAEINYTPLHRGCTRKHDSILPAHAPQFTSIGNPPWSESGIITTRSSF
jgi:hypothetical protein